MSHTPGDEDRPIHIGQEAARGAQRVGLIWMLVASLVVIIVVMAGVLGWCAGGLAQANREGGPGGVRKTDAAQFHVPAPPPASVYNAPGG
jgi:hypothetical protein